MTQAVPPRPNPDERIGLCIEEDAAFLYETVIDGLWARNDAALYLGWRLLDAAEARIRGEDEDAPVCGDETEYVEKGLRPSDMADPSRPLAESPATARARIRASLAAQLNAARDGAREARAEVERLTLGIRRWAQVADHGDRILPSDLLSLLAEQPPEDGK